MAAIDVASEAEFDAKISGAGDKLVVIDYSTTWCGPCKVIAPKFDELSDKYSDSIFIKVRLALKMLECLI
jgi:thioredoxin 1